MNKRIKNLRQHLGVTLEEFGTKLGVTKATVSRWENGERSISEQAIRLICSEFNVNEDWLRTGAGGDENMFIPDDAMKYLNIGKAARTPNDFRDFLVHVMETLPDEYCEYLYNEFKRFESERKQKKGE